MKVIWSWSSSGQIQDRGGPESFGNFELKRRIGIYYLKK